MGIFHLRRYATITLLAAGAFLALIALALFQYHWIERAAALDRARSESQLNNKLSDFARDFDREIASATGSLRIIDRISPSDSAQLPTLDYRTAGRQLIQGVYFGELTSVGGLRLFQIKGEFTPPAPVAWPGGLSDLRARLTSEASGVRVSVPGPWRVVPQGPALVRLGLRPPEKMLIKQFQ